MYYKSMDKLSEYNDVQRIFYINCNVRIESSELDLIQVIEEEDNKNNKYTYNNITNNK